MMVIEVAFSDFLRKELNTPSYLEEPAEPPKKYLVVEKTSAGGSAYIKQATVAVQSYARTLKECAELSEQVIDAARRFPKLDEVTRVDLNSEYNFTDTTRKRHRYQAVFDITYY